MKPSIFLPKTLRKAIFFLAIAMVATALHAQAAIELKKSNSIMNDKNTGEIILYQPDDTVRLEVRIEDETVLLTQAQMVELFQREVSVISLHIANIFKDGELDKIKKIYCIFAQKINNNCHGPLS